MSVAGDAGCPGRLLGRQVLHRAHDLAGGGQRHLVRDAGDAEVGDLDAAVRGDEEVARLDVAVHETGGVRGLQCRGRLRDDVERLVGGGAEPSRSRIVESASPGTSSITRKAEPFSSP